MMFRYGLNLNINSYQGVNSQIPMELCLQSGKIDICFVISLYANK